MKDELRDLVAPLGGDTEAAVGALLALIDGRLVGARLVSRPALVIVSGIPGAGKSTLARALAPALGVPYLDRDELKDTMFDTIGWSDREWSKRIGAVSWDLLYLVARRALTERRLVVLESNFDKRGHPDRLPALRRDIAHELIEVCCVVDPQVARERYWARWDAGERHPGHDETAFDRDAPWIVWPTDPPTGVADHLIEVDTTDPVNVDAIASRVRALIEEGT